MVAVHLFVLNIVFHVKTDTMQPHCGGQRLVLPHLSWSHHLSSLLSEERISWAEGCEDKMANSCTADFCLISVPDTPVSPEIFSGGLTQ